MKFLHNSLLAEETDAKVAKFCNIWVQNLPLFSVQLINFKNSFSGWAPGPISNFLDLSQPNGMKMIFHLSRGMAV